MSDALAWLHGQASFSHVFLQTHGWNTPPYKAVKIPFSQFMAGMQDDATMPKGPNFKPLFIAFTWQSLPLKFLQQDDALARAELLGPAISECEMEEDAEASEAAAAVAAAARGATPPELPPTPGCTPTTRPQKQTGSSSAPFRQVPSLPETSRRLRTAVSLCRTLWRSC